MARRSPRPEATHEKTLIPLQEHCEQCGQLFWVAHHSHRTVAMLSGLWRLTLVVRQCAQPSCLRFHQSYRPEEEGRWALPHGEFGLEVIALIGMWRFREHRSVPEMHQALVARGISIAQRSVTYLMQRYPRTGDLAYHGSGAHQGTLAAARTRHLGGFLDCNRMWATKCSGSCVTASPKKSC
jgi:hypothetical protein